MIVLPMYMGVILGLLLRIRSSFSAPHVYGGDPGYYATVRNGQGCSPCIWG